MKVIGLDAISRGELNSELQRGGKFIAYQYCISLVFVTFKRFSNIYFVRAGKSGAAQMAMYSGISLLLGWWGIPWGPIYTVGALITNLRGGKDLTQQVVASLHQGAASSVPVPPSR